MAARAALERRYSLPVGRRARESGPIGVAPGGSLTQTVMLNRQIKLAARPVGLPKVSDFQLAYSARPSPASNEVLVRSVYLSLDPYMRGRMNDAASYVRPLAIGDVMPGG